MQIYIHIPFCRAKCKYCAFNSIVAQNDLIDEYVDALCMEIKQSIQTQAVSTIYFGGGTPSILNIKQLSKIVDTLYKDYDLSHCIEFTIEANPGTVNKSYFNDLRKLGINRLSLGVQSFDDKLLHNLGRIHNSEEAIENVKTAVSIFDNVSIDLMYDLPNQTAQILKNTLDTAITLHTQHISIYGLEVEEGTEFGRLQGLGDLKLPDDDESDKMYELITKELPQHGFQRYEISNFAIEGFESRHNLGYWSDTEYLGLGAGAHSYIQSESTFGLRFSNTSNIREYIDGIKSGLDIKITEEILTQKAAMEEFCFLALRKAEGIDLNQFTDKFGVDINCVYSETIDKLKYEGLIDVSNSHIKLNKRGMKYGNYAFAEFLLDP
ncbi:MAG: radical SAM family heme chaperone HemW [Selenomonadaceae bacterium]|nr:radical SAM family heme chaperone HemW [Selenomonadaceae bacterium]